MPKANVNVKIDSDVKQLATQLLERMGLDQTTAIDIFFRQIISEKRLPFQPVVNLTLEEQIAAAALRRNPKRIKLEADAKGNVVLDKKLHPKIHDWAVKG